jgi:hypothetical protein
LGAESDLDRSGPSEIRFSTHFKAQNRSNESAIPIGLGISGAKLNGESEDNDRFFKDFAAAYSKLLALGVPKQKDAGFFSWVFSLCR